MQLELKPWVYNNPPPYHVNVWGLFDVSPFSSVASKPTIFHGSMQYIDDKPVFYVTGAYEPLHTHWIMICWRYA